MTQEVKGDETLEKIIDLAHKVADEPIRAYKFCVKLLSILLLVSMCANVWLLIKGGPKITFGADYNVESDIDQTNNE